MREIRIILITALIKYPYKTVSNITAIAGPSASQLPLMLPAINTAPVIDPNQPLITAPYEAATSRELEKKEPLALRPKQSAPPTTISKHPVSQKAGIFSPVERVASPKNTTMPSIRLIFICVFDGLLKV